MAESEDRSPMGAGDALAGGSDEVLMMAFARGSLDAFGELFGRYKQPLFGFFRRRVVDVGVAEELTQGDVYGGAARRGEI